MKLFQISTRAVPFGRENVAFMACGYNNNMVHAVPFVRFLNKLHFADKRVRPEVSVLLHFPKVNILLLYNLYKL